MTKNTFTDKVSEIFGMFQKSITLGSYRVNTFYLILAVIILIAMCYLLLKGSGKRKKFRKLSYSAPKKQKTAAELSNYSDSRQIKMIVEGLGGSDNIKNIDCCASRLNVTVENAEKVINSTLKRSGASGVIRHGNEISVIYGPKVETMLKELRQILGR